MVHASLLRKTVHEIQSNFHVISLPGNDPDLPFIVPEFKYFLNGSQIGYAEINIDRNDEMVDWLRFFPHSCKKSLIRCGLGTLAHVSTLIELVENYDVLSHYVVGHLNPSDSRRTHLEKMNVLDQHLSIDEYLSRSIEYAMTKGFQFDNPFD